MYLQLFRPLGSMMVVFSSIVFLYFFLQCLNDLSHRLFCLLVHTVFRRVDSSNSSYPALVVGWQLTRNLTSRSTWAIHRWNGIPGQQEKIAAIIPFCPSLVAILDDNISQIYEKGFPGIFFYHELFPSDFDYPWSMKKIIAVYIFPLNQVVF